MSARTSEPDSPDPPGTSEPDPPRDWAHDAWGRGCFAIDLDGQRQSFVPSIRDRLIARGVLTCVDGIWRLAWHGFDLEKEKAADLSCCDFCSARPVTWLCPCETFRMPTPPGDFMPTYSTGDWAACDACGVLVDARKKAALLARCQAQPTASDVLPPVDEQPRELRRLLRQMRTETHERFWRHYRGGAVRVAPHPFGH